MKSADLGQKHLCEKTHCRAVLGHSGLDVKVFLHVVRQVGCLISIT